ncbi:hypothetical protein SAMN05444161_5293 [Rhizobiales bacterium GAS191]|nr:hypothetical protein SAMN05444161_5293 [Rhizobiales bacterium GAS191]
MDSEQAIGSLKIHPVREAEIRAIEAFISKSTIPLLIKKEGKLILLGTGTLFRVSGRFFIITARHLLDAPREGIDVFVVPDSQIGPKITQLQRISYSAPDTEDIDVGAFEILDGESIQAIQQNWNFLTLDNVRIDGFGAPLWIYGYPVERSDLDSVPFRIESISIVTELLEGVPAGASEPIREGLDFFLVHSKTGLEVAIRNPADVPKEGKTPRLRGVSGASVWYVDQPPIEGIWGPERVTKAVAIQVSVAHGNFVRVQSWVAVAILMSMIDAELQKEVETKLGLRVELGQNSDGKAIVRSLKRM